MRNLYRTRFLDGFDREVRKKVVTTVYEWDYAIGLWATRDG
jgi:hypothetical protein